ncbi:MAG TPA: hypothetical protein V6D11_02105 [Waterburya sp.]|jgi:hypothetical protein
MTLRQILLGEKGRKPNERSIENVCRHLRRRQRQPNVVQRFFGEKHTAYAAQ